ncbi:MAG: methionine--tRNA ligase [Polyangiaceae bacterium]|nr:methionine--tRNA ligase [Polyangiaceae bacterium]
MTSRFYVTTPIYYINDVPHLGTAYTTIAADVMCRYHRTRGHESRFLTGTDEHGQKVQRAAEEQNLPPNVYADQVSRRFSEAWPKLACAPDDFIRTTDPRHKTWVQDFWKKIFSNGHIYLGHYEGLYCVRCEGYYTEKELRQPGNICPIHNQPVEVMKEPSYFFKLSQFQDKLLAFYEAHPDFVRPEGRFNELKSFVQSGLQDLSVSRTSFQWGIPVPGDEQHVMYVWFDALSNYYSALTSPEDNTRYWPNVVHIMGKDILRFHACYWPAFLMAAGMEPPPAEFAHGFLTYCGEKMSKSLRNTISPTALAEAISPTIGADVVRYTLMRAIAFGQDGDFAIADLMQRYSSELGNQLGNLLNRVLPFAETVPEKGPLTALEENLIANYPDKAKAAADAFTAVNPTAALGHIWSILALANEYIDKAAPWVAKKNDPVRLGTIIATAVSLLEAVSVMIWPVMPNVAASMREQLGLSPLQGIVGSDQWPHVLPNREPGGRLMRGTPIFPRFEKEKEAELLEKFSPPKEPVMSQEQAPSTAPANAPTTDVAPAAPAAPREAKAVIQYDDFAKMDLRVGLVLSAERVKKKDKLLDLRVDVGEAAPRRIVAGIAKNYAPDQITGKKVVVLCNLAPREVVKGYLSEGMLLAGGDGDVLKVATLDGELPPGSTVK